MDPFELSRSPYLNDVIRLAREAWSDPELAAHHQPELAERIQVLAEFTEALARQFTATMQARPRTAVAAQVSARAGQGFEELKQALARLRSWLKTADREHLREGCERGRGAVEILFGCFEELKAEEETFPTFSRSPFIQELVRVALGVARGELPEGALRERLGWMEGRFREFRRDFAAWFTAPRENQMIDELLPEAGKALDGLGAALEEMGRYLTTRRREHLKGGCQALLTASNRLVELQRQIVEASSPQGAACPRCAAGNPGGARTCGACGAILPEIADQPTQTLELREASQERPRFSHLIRLEDAISGFLEERVPKRELSDTIRWFAQKARAGRKQLEAMPAPEDRPGDPVPSLAGQTRALMDRGTQAVLRGTERLETYLQREERALLDEGLADIQEGARWIMEAQELAASRGATG